MTHWLRRLLDRRPPVVHVQIETMCPACLERQIQDTIARNGKTVARAMGLYLMETRR